MYLSGKKKDEIEGEIRGFLDDSMARTKKLLRDNEQQLHTVSGRDGQAVRRIGILADL